MSVIGIILLVVFVIICILLVGIVLIQSEEGDGLGGLFGGTNSQAFGSKSGNIITKTTYVLVTLFFLTTFGLALVNKAPEVKGLDEVVNEEQKMSDEDVEYWKNTAEPTEIKAEVVPTAPVDSGKKTE